MNASETGRLLRMISALEGREIDPFEHNAWHAVIGDLNFEDVRDAAVAHYRTSADRLAAFGHRSVPVRLAVAMGRLDPAALEPGDGWPELYDDWDEMAEAQLWAPGDPDGHLPQACRTGGV